VILSLEVDNEELERELEKEKELSSMERQNMERTFDKKIMELSSENSRLKSIADGFLDNLEETKARNEKIRIELETRLDEVISEKQLTDDQMLKLQRTREVDRKDLTSENARLNVRVESLNNVIAAKEMETMEAKDQRQMLEKKMAELVLENSTLNIMNGSLADEPQSNQTKNGRKLESLKKNTDYNVSDSSNEYFRENSSLRQGNQRFQQAPSSPAPLKETISEYSHKVNSRYQPRKREDHMVDTESRDDGQLAKIRSVSRDRCSELAVINDRSSRVNDIATKPKMDSDDYSARRGRGVGRAEERSSDSTSSYRSCSPSMRSRTEPKTSMKNHNSSQIQAYPPYSPSQPDNSTGRVSAGCSSVGRNKYGLDDGSSSTSRSSRSSVHSFDRNKSPASMSNSERLRIKSLISKYDCQ